MKRNLIILLTLLSLTSMELFSQQADNLISQEELKAFTLSGTIEALNINSLKNFSNTNLSDSNIKFNTSDENRLSAKQNLQDEFDYLNSKINEISQFREEIKDLNIRLKLSTGIISVEKIVSPTSSALGKSFSSVLSENAGAILKPAIKEKKRGIFGKILNLVVNNPLVSSFTESNPITKMAGDVANQFIAASEGSEKGATALIKFKESLDEYLEFYSSIDRNTLSFEKDINDISNQLDISEQRLTRVELEINKLLDSIDESSKEDAIKKLLQIDKKDSMKSDEIFTLLISQDIRKLNKLIDRISIIQDEFNGNPQRLIDSFNNYIENLKQILTKAKDNSTLAFKKNNIDTVIAKLQPIE